jgi:type II secretion system protein I
MDRRGGFSLLEVLVATVIMGIAVTTLIVGLSNSVRNADRLASHDRAALLARNKMNELLLDPALPFAGQVAGAFGAAAQGEEAAGWRAVTRPFEMRPGDGPGAMVLQEIALEVWWQPRTGDRRAIQLQTYRQTRVPVAVAQ